MAEVDDGARSSGVEYQRAPEDVAKIGEAEIQSPSVEGNTVENTNNSKGK